MKKSLIISKLLLVLLTFNVLGSSYSSMSEVNTASEFHDVDIEISSNSDDLPFKH